MSATNILIQKKFQERQTVAKERLYDYLEKQGEKQIHDLRTSIRRLDTAYLVLPNSCKNKATRDFVCLYKSLFKKNSIVRDFDVAIAKLQQYGFEKDSKIIERTVKQREKNLKVALRKAKKVSKLILPKVSKINSLKAGQKFEKTIALLTAKMLVTAQTVIRDESKTSKLHLMRKLAKKLRYILEMCPEGTSGQIQEHLKSFQNLLGDIHDCDMMVRFLKDRYKEFPELKPFLTREQHARHRLYCSFANPFSTE